jgi:hypothetical protein
MASRQTWQGYNEPNADGLCVVETDEELVSMIRDVVETIHTLERMYGQSKAQLTVRALIMDWQALSNMASARGIRSYERI